MRCCELLRCRVEVDVVCQACISPSIGVAIPFVAVARCCIDCNPVSVNITFVPPVVELGDVLFCRPVVVLCSVKTDVVSVYNPSRNSLRPGKRADCCRIADTGCSNLAVFTVRTLFLVSNVIEVLVRINILLLTRSKSNIVIVEVFCDIFINLQKLFVICRCTLYNLIGNRLDIA